MAIVSILNIRAHGHINPTLAVARELVRRGDTVRYFAPEAFSPAIEATGALFQPYRISERLAQATRAQGSSVGTRSISSACCPGRCANI
jgi:UDP:flavonoid glycosyltransferase YjiC (YdhE family)